jgi:hypothetical protein
MAMDVIVLPGAGIHEDKSLPGLNRPAEGTAAQLGRHAGVAGEAVEEVDGQGRTGGAEGGGPSRNGTDDHAIKIHP